MDPSCSREDVLIRELCPWDAPSVQKINKGIGWEDYTSGIFRSLDRVFKKERGMFSWVIQKRDSSECLGYIVVRDKENRRPALQGRLSHDSVIGRVYFLAVSEKMQRKGIGEELMKKAVEHTRRVSSKLDLHCERENLPFYQRLAEKQNLGFQSEWVGTYSSGLDKYHCIFDLFPKRRMCPNELAFS